MKGVRLGFGLRGLGFRVALYALEVHVTVTLRTKLIRLSMNTPRLKRFTVEGVVVLGLAFQA